MIKLTEDKRRELFFQWMDTLPKENRHRIHETNELTSVEEISYANYINSKLNVL